MASGSLFGARGRTLMMILAMSIGVASVVVLTALGEGARRYVVDQFASLGSDLLIVLPGRSETTGGPPPLLGETPRPLTVDDALALTRDPYIRRVAPIAVGSADVSFSGRTRETTIVGSTEDYQFVRRLDLLRGRFLRTPDPHRANAECVVGAKLERELFAPGSALGQWLRLGDRRCRVVGVLSSQSFSLGLDLGDLVIVPVESALILFNNDSLFRVLVEARSREELEAAKRSVRRIIKTRHEGEDDVTIISQDSVVATFDKILVALTLAVAGIAGIALAVAGILIMNVMLIAVSQRTAEVGVLKAVGAPRRQIVLLFLAEAAALALVGALAGLVAGQIGAWILARLYPVLPIAAPWWATVAAVVVALGTGLIFGILPARRAARLDPVLALSRK